MATLSASQSADAPRAVAEIANFPPAKVPVAPVLSLASFRDGSRGPRPLSVLDTGVARYTTSGRTAIALALKLMGVGAGDCVLVPAYHCAAMIEPVIWSGATPVFYRIRPDTSIDLDDIAAKLQPRTKALLAANYFGFPQDLGAIRAFCDARGLQFIEDCAHCFLGEHAGKPVGSYGDYAIASTMKFFPIYEGGALVSSRHALDSVQLHSAGKGFEVKVAINTLEDAFVYRRLGLLRLLLWAPMAAKDFLWSQIKARGAAPAQPMVPGSSEGGFSFDPSWMDKRSSLFSRTMLAWVSRRRMGERRRRNYLRIEQALQGVPGWRPLFPHLPDGVYPWTYPIIADQAQPVFRALKLAGVPIMRFGEYLRPEVTPEVCANACHLSRNSMQFPVHQELRDDELDWIINHIKEALTAHASS